jgi:hypothetical protein
LNFPRDVAGNTDPFLRITGGANPRILSEDVSLAGPANLEITALNTEFTGVSGNAVTIYADNGEILGDANLVLTTNNSNTGNTKSWTFDTTGNFSVPGNILVSGVASPAPYISGFSSITTVDGANIAGFVFDQSNLTLSGNTVAINFANGSAAFGNIVATNLDGNVSNVLTGNGTFVALPVINANTVVWTTAPVANTSAGTAGEAAYDTGGNLYVCVSTNTWAKFIGTTSW